MKMFVPCDTSKSQVPHHQQWRWQTRKWKWNCAVENKTLMRQRTWGCPGKLIPKTTSTKPCSCQSRPRLKQGWVTWNTYCDTTFRKGNGNNKEDNSKTKISSELWMTRMTRNLEFKVQGFSSACERQKIPFSWWAGNRARGTGTAEAPGVEQESLVRGETNWQPDVGVMEPGQKERHCLGSASRTQQLLQPPHRGSNSTSTEHRTHSNRSELIPAAQGLLPEGSKQHPGLSQTLQQTQLHSVTPQPALGNFCPGQLWQLPHSWHLPASLPTPSNWERQKPAPQRWQEQTREKETEVLEWLMKLKEKEWEGTNVIWVFAAQNLS